MSDHLVIGFAQTNPIVGDVAGNVQKIREARRAAIAQGAHLVVSSELILSAYPPEDLILKPSFQKTIYRAIEELAQETADGKAAYLIGAPWVEDDKLYNAMVLLDGGKIVGRALKHDLPNYGPFDEKRIFTSWPMPDVLNFRGIKLGVMICEDMWQPKVARILKDRGAQILIVPNGSPFEVTKQEQRLYHARARISETGLALAYVHQVGGQDELVFDGASFVLNAAGRVAAQAAGWREDLVVMHFNPSHDGLLVPELADCQPQLSGDAAIYQALMIGLRDYVNKNGFKGVVLGLSGGIDSALVLALATDALGAERVWGVMMPSPYTSQDSLDDAAALARNTECRYDTISIVDAMQGFEKTLHPIFNGKEADVTEENIQARCRGLLLMALSNKFGPMVLSTGNKSEMSVGYSTLYGDLCGGYAVLKDVYKTQVYRLARWRNANMPQGGLGQVGQIIPDRVFTKAPTAELRPNQTDQDSLPPYDKLDDILTCLIEKDLGIASIVSRGHPEELVARVWRMLDGAEYKRRQAPPGVKITSRLLGKDRRYPITNKYREA